MNSANQALLNKHKDILSFRDLSLGTVSTYVSYLTVFLEWFEQNLPGHDVNDVTWEQIRSYVSFLKKVRKLNSRTVNVHISQLRDFFHYVLHRDWDRYEVPFLHFDEKLPVVPTRQEIITTIDSFDNLKHKAQIALLYSSGIRVSELCRLKCGDIIRSRNCIYIAKTKNRSDRYAILSEKCYKDLVAYIRACYPNAKKDDWLFPGQKKGCPVSTQTVYNLFIQQLNLIGLGDKGFTLHSLRHAFGLHLYESGADIMSIKESMGHKSLSSTAVYLTLGIGNGRSVKSPYDFD